VDPVHLYLVRHFLAPLHEFYSTLCPPNGQPVGHHQWIAGQIITLIETSAMMAVLIGAILKITEVAGSSFMPYMIAFM